MSKKNLHPDQIRDRELLIKHVPDEDMRMTMGISMFKHAWFMTEFLEKQSEFFDIPTEILYRMALTINFGWVVFGDHGDPENKYEEFPYEPTPHPKTIEDKLSKVLKFLIKEAKARKIIE